MRKRPLIIMIFAGLVSAAIVIIVLSLPFLWSSSKPLATTPTLVPTVPPTPDHATLLKQAKRIPYKDLARNTEQYIGEYVLYSGEVVQVIEEGRDYILRVNITRHDYGWEDPVLVVCKNCYIRPLVDDVVVVFGQVTDRVSYETVSGTTVTLPQIDANVTLSD